MSTSRSRVVVDLRGEDPRAWWPTGPNPDAAETKFDEHEQRLPRGVPGGGRWTRGGAIAEALSNLPLPPRESQTRRVKPERLLADPTRMDSLPEDVQAKLVDHVQQWFHVTPAQIHDNLRAVFDRAPDSIREQGKAWYHSAGAEAGRIAADVDAGHTRRQMVGAIAATSPQMEWGANLAEAEYIAHATAEDWPVDAEVVATLRTTMKMKVQRRTKYTLSLLDWAKTETYPDTDWWTTPGGDTRLSDYPVLARAALIKAMGQAGMHTVDGKPLAYWDDVRRQRNAVSFSSGLDGMTKALRILDGAEPTDVLNGHKVRSFYNNILLSEDNPFPDVTMDTHAVSAAVGKAMSSGSKQMTTGFTTPSVGPLGLSGTYPVFADAYRAIARETGLSPHQAQAIIWLQWREEHP